MPPKTLMEFVELLRDTPREILSDKERAMIVASMQFKNLKVSDVMIPREKIMFVKEDDFLGPLMLDKLYHSGMTQFPVLDKTGRQIVGSISTEKLNSLEIRENEQAKNFIEHEVYYLRNDYSLEQAVSAFIRTSCYFFIVVNRLGQVIGVLPYKDLVSVLLGYIPHDDFKDDNSLGAVIRRNID